MLPFTNPVPTPENGKEGGSDGKNEDNENKQGGNGNKNEGSPTQNGGSNGSHGKPDAASTTYTVVTVPTTIQTTMNGVPAQILTVVPITSAVAVDNSADAVSTPSSTADAGNAQPPPPVVGSDSGTGDEPVAPLQTPSHPHASPTDTPLDATDWQPTQPGRSDLTYEPVLPANNTTLTGSTSSRPAAVTAGAPGLAEIHGMRTAVFVFALAALL